MAKKNSTDGLKAHYDPEQDILYLTFTEQAREAVAEEVGDEVFVRYDPDTREIVDIEFLNLSARLEQAFGEDMKFIDSPREERLLFPIQ